ncbi:unnamed protein product [Peniophora sp. CBMAI 1063]|nr:unnamed protein product [Peniophora sp. CBMAI 1063]
MVYLVIWISEGRNLLSIVPLEITRDYAPLWSTPCKVFKGCPGPTSYISSLDFATPQLRRSPPAPAFSYCTLKSPRFLVKLSMAARGMEDNGVANLLAALGMPPLGELQAVLNSLQAQVPNHYVAPVAPPPNTLLANPQLLLAVKLMQEHPQLLQPQNQPGPSTRPNDQPIPRQAKEKMFREAQSQQYDATLIFFISGARIIGESKFAAFENLHGKLGNSADWWRCYYLVHQDRLDPMVASFHSRAYPLHSAVSASRKRHRSPSPAADSTASEIVDITDEVLATSAGRPYKASRRAREAEEAEAPTPSTSGTSLATGSTDLAIPAELPEHPPPPPTNPVKFREGKHRFTPEDETFFANLILWHAKEAGHADAHELKKTILIALATQAPHHSHLSWDNYWNKRQAGAILEQGLRMAKAEAKARAVKTESQGTEP